MADIQEIPRLVKEFYELAKTYLLQETVGPAKKLGHFAGFSLGAALLWGTAIVLLAVAGLRALYDALPSSPYWEAVAYIMFAIMLIAVVAVLVKVAPDRGVHDVQASHPVPQLESVPAAQPSRVQADSQDSAPGTPPDTPAAPTQGADG